MPNYSTYFGGEVWEGVLPPDFTSRWRTPIGQPGALIEPTGIAVPNKYGRLTFAIDDNGGGEKLYSWDRASYLGDDTTDLDMLCLYYVETSSTTDNMAGLWARASGGVNTENGYVCEMRNSFGTVTFRVLRFDAGAATALGSVSNTFSLQTWYWMQYRIQGSNHQIRHWEYGTTPPDWQSEFVDATHTADGWCGIGTTGGGELYFDYYAVATQGDAVELPFDPIVQANDNTITAYNPTCATDATSFLVYTGEPNVAVDWNLTGDGSLSVITDYTDAAGRAFAVYTPGTVGTKTVDVTVGVPV